MKSYKFLIGVIIGIIIGLVSPVFVNVYFFGTEVIGDLSIDQFSEVMSDLLNDHCR